MNILLPEPLTSLPDDIAYRLIRIYHSEELSKVAYTLSVGTGQSNRHIDQPQRTSPAGHRGKAERLAESGVDEMDSLGALSEIQFKPCREQQVKQEPAEAQIIKHVKERIEAGRREERK